MPTFTGKKFSNFYKNLLGIDQSSNTGIGTTIKTIQDGAGANTALGLSDDHCKVKPATASDTVTFIVHNKTGDEKFRVDTLNSLVKAGMNSTNVLTQYKEMGLYEFSPTAGYHHPLISNNMMNSDSGTTFIQDLSFGSNGTDPATTLDVSGLTNEEQAIACYWYMHDAIQLSTVRYLAYSEDSGGASLNMHLVSYALDTSSNHGDLSDGDVIAQAHSHDTINETSVTTGTMTLLAGAVAVNRIVIGYVETDSTSDITISFNIKYYIQ